MIVVSTEEMQSELASLIESVKQGETILITEANQLIAEVKPIAQPKSVELRPFGLCVGEFIVPDDFDEPLPQDVLELFEGR